MPPEHGYQMGCRCDVCKRAKARDAMRVKRAERSARLKADPTLRMHGDSNTYTNWGCRCTLCCAAWNVSSSGDRRTRRKPGVREERERLLYKPLTGNPHRRRNVEPFGREWLDDNTVRPD